MSDKTKTSGDSAKSGGKTLVSWSMPEFPVYQRSPDWFFAMGLLGGILILYSVFTGNFLFAVIIVLTALIVFTRSHTQPAMIDFSVMEDGVKVGDVFYKYRELRDFFIIYNPPEVKTIFFDFKSSWRPHMAIPLYNQDPVKVRKALLEHLDEDLKREEEPVSDQIARFLKM